MRPWVIEHVAQAVPWQQQDFRNDAPRLTHIFERSPLWRGDDQHAVGKLESGQGHVVERMWQVQHDVTDVPPQRAKRCPDVIASDRLAFLGPLSSWEDAQRA